MKISRASSRKTMKRRSPAIVASVAVAALVATAVGAGSAAPAQSAGKGVIGVNLPFVQADVYRPLIAGAKAEAAKRGYKLLQSSSQLDANKQLGELHAWIGERINAMT